MKKLFTIILLLVVMSVTPISASAKQMTTTKKAEAEINHRYYKARFLSHTKNNDDACWRVILHRKGKSYTVVEKIIGTVANSKKDGMDSCGFYISYRGLKNVKKGSKVVTYLVYCRKCNEPDDVVARYDVVVRK